MSEALIIRSASTQQLDLNLPAIRSRFKHSDLSVLTHEHSVGQMEKYTDIHQIYEYNHKSGFRPGRKAAQLKGQRFDAVVVLTANTSASGYLNVLLFALTVPAREIYICNSISEIAQCKKSAIILRALFTVIFKFVSILLTPPAAVVMAVVAGLATLWHIILEGENI